MEDYQDTTAPRREQPRAPEHVFREQLKKHAAIKACYFDGNSVQRSEVRRVGLSRLQFGDVDYYDNAPVAGPTSPHISSLTQMEAPVALTRTLSRTTGLGALSRRRTQSHGHGDGTDDSGSQSDSDTSESAYERGIWDAGVAGFLGAGGLQYSSSSSTASAGGATGFPPRRPSLALGLDEGGARPYLASPLARPPGSRDAPAGGLPSDPDMAAPLATLDGCTVVDSGCQDGAETDAAGLSAYPQDRRAVRVDRLLEDLRKDDPRDASPYIGARMRRASQRISTSTDFESPMRRSRTNTMAMIYQLDQQVLQGADTSLSGEASFKGLGGAATAAGPQSPLGVNRSVAAAPQSPGAGCGPARFRRGSTLTDVSRWGAEGELASAGSVSAVAGTGARPLQRAATSHLSGQQGSHAGLVGTQPSASSPLATAPGASDTDYPPQHGAAAALYVSSPNSSSKLLRIAEDAPSLSPRVSLHGQAHRPAHLSPTPHLMSGMTAPPSLGSVRRQPSRSNSHTSLEAAARTAMGSAGGGAVKTVDSRASSRRLSTGPYMSTAAFSPLSKGVGGQSQHELRQQLQHLGSNGSRATGALNTGAEFGFGAHGEGRMLGTAVSAVNAEGLFVGAEPSRGSNSGAATPDLCAVRLPSLSLVGGFGGSRGRG